MSSGIRTDLFKKSRYKSIKYSCRHCGKRILQLRGVRPFLSDKYDLTQHPNYKLTSDYDPKNIFDIEKYLNRKEKIHPGDEFIVVDADSLPPA